MDYKQKYLKYKSKYLLLRELEGGGGNKSWLAQTEIDASDIKYSYKFINNTIKNIRKLGVVNEITTLHQKNSTLDLDFTPLIWALDALNHFEKHDVPELKPEKKEELIKLLKQLITELLERPDVEVNTALHFAVLSKNNIEIVNKLLAKKANPNLLNYINTPLHIAIQENNIDAVSPLLLYGANINIINKEGNTPLHIAMSKKDNIDMIKILLENGAKINKLNKYGNTPLYDAITNNTLEKFNDLLTEIEKIKKNEIQDIYKLALFNSVKLNNIDVFNLLLKKNIKIDENYKYKDGNTLLHVLILQGAHNNDDITNMLKIILPYFKDINIKNTEGKTPFHCIIKIKNKIENLIQLFLENGADPNIKDNKGNTVLHLAIDELNYQMVDYRYGPNKKNIIQNILIILLNNGADPNATNDEGDTFLHMLLKREWIVDNNDTYEIYLNLIASILQLLITKSENFYKYKHKYKYDINHKNNNGDTLLHLGAEICRFNVNEDFIKFLQTYGSDGNILNNMLQSYKQVRENNCKKPE